MRAIVEGATQLRVAQTNLQERGPGRIDPGAPFYNPAMALNRDLGVLTVQTHLDAMPRSIDVADVLAGTGARTLRLAVEVEGDLTIHANDGDPTGIEALRNGLLENQVPEGRVEPRVGNAHGFLASRRFDVTDIDPFGSPLPFLDGAMYGMRHGGILMLTATDTGCLNGTYPKACLRRYGARPFHGATFRAEVGLRILLANAAWSAGRFERAIEPLWSAYHGHWMRIAVRVVDGRAKADAMQKRIGPAWFDPTTGRCTNDGPASEAFGPMWWGELHDGAFLDAMLARQASLPLHQAKEVEKLLQTLRQEVGAGLLFTDPSHFLRRFALDQAPKRDRWTQAIQERGFQAGRSHCDPQALKSNAPAEVLHAAWTAAGGSPIQG